MEGSFFKDGTRPPDDDELAAALGDASAHWNEIVAHVDGAQPGLRREWKYYRGTHGWQLKVASRKRAVCYLIPHDGGFRAGLALNDAAVDAVRASGLPELLIREIESAKSYPEGRPARVEVTDSRQAAVVKRLITIKLEN